MKVLLLQLGYIVTEEDGILFITYNDGSVFRIRDNKKDALEVLMLSLEKCPVLNHYSGFSHILDVMIEFPYGIEMINSSNVLIDGEGDDLDEEEVNRVADAYNLQDYDTEE